MIIKWMDTKPKPLGQEPLNHIFDLKMFMVWDCLAVYKWFNYILLRYPLSNTIKLHGPSGI
jgi:hypothetical protein